MDGTRSSRFVRGYLNRPASLEIINRDYPDIVIGLISGSPSISYSLDSGPNGARNVLITTYMQFEKRFLLREEDFIICKSIAELFSQRKGTPGPVSAFLSEPVQDLRKRIAAYLVVEFAGRG